MDQHPTPPQAETAATKRTKQAQQLLESRQFAAAGELYGELLEEFPESDEFLLGYFSSRYWSIRQSRVETIREGRQLADFLLLEWERFQAEIERRKLDSTPLFHSVMKAILGEAASQLRIAWQEEGGGSHVDLGVLLQLVRCLIRLNESENAGEILRYSLRLHRNHPEILALLAENTLLNSTEPTTVENGLSLYRDAFLIDSEKVDLEFVRSQPLTRIFDYLRTNEQNSEAIALWTPPLLMAHASRAANLRPLQHGELETILQELARLSRDLDRTAEKFRRKVEARLAFYLLVLLQHYRFHKDGTEEAEPILLEKLEKVAPLVTRYLKELET